MDGSAAGDSTSQGGEPTYPTASTKPQQAKLAFSDFPKNSQGLTYGSDAQADTVDQAPDLIAVTMDDGGLGFVRKDDLWAPPPSSPDEAIARQEQLSNGNVPSYPAFDLDGNRIGTFTEIPGSVSYDVTPR